ISSTFVELLSTKPFDRITIKDIVDACGINRNTFYYYYSDIYDLLEEIFKKELNEIIDGHRETGSYVEGLIKVANVAYSHKKLINNICSSRSYEYLENYMYKSCKSIMVDVVSNMSTGLNVPEDDIDFIASFYEYAFIGVISEWFRTGMRESPTKFASQLWLVVDGINRALRKSAKRHRELSE
ncbi:MAG: TetR/AcrR family transcriptional regulator, partial [Clostridia bacterium]|nr:TetR/AcrR family transcriptional regulator [Clostridia bacterium]